MLGTPPQNVGLKENIYKFLGTVDDVDYFIDANAKEFSEVWLLCVYPQSHSGPLRIHTSLEANIGGVAWVNGLPVRMTPTEREIGSALAKLWGYCVPPRSKLQPLKPS